MGCPCLVEIESATPLLGEAVARRCEVEARRFESKYSRYLPDSITTRIIEGAGSHAVSIDNETSALLDFADVCFQESNGLFDLTSGALRHVWYRGRDSMPTGRCIEQALERVGWQHVERTVGEIYLPIPGMELDFGGLVKEYAADALVNLARDAGISHGLINLGGDISVIGPPTGEPAWSIGISNPESGGPPIAFIPLCEGAITTSGTYERFIVIAGNRISHLINPKTGYPPTSLLGVSVVASTAIVAGSLSSIALLMNEQDALQFLADSGALYLASTSGGEVHGDYRDLAGSTSH